MMEAVRRGDTPALPAGTPDELVALLKRCWALKPSDRPNAAQVLTDLDPLLVRLDPVDGRCLTPA